MHIHQSATQRAYALQTLNASGRNQARATSHIGNVAVAASCAYLGSYTSDGCTELGFPWGGATFDFTNVCCAFVAGILCTTGMSSVTPLTHWGSYPLRQTLLAEGYRPTSVAEAPIGSVCFWGLHAAFHAGLDGSKHYVIASSYDDAPAPQTIRVDINDLREEVPDLVLAPPF